MQDTAFYHHQSPAKEGRSGPKRGVVTFTPVSNRKLIVPLVPLHLTTFHFRTSQLAVFVYTAFPPG
jgi:hypothetical protein